MISVSNGALIVKKDIVKAFRSGWRAAKANAVPMVVLWALSIALIASYYRVQAVADCLRYVEEWQVRYGHLAAFANRVFFGGVVPWVFMVCIRRLRPARPFAVLFATSLYCGLFGIVVETMYVAHARLFGTGIDFATLLKKTLSAQFLWTPLIYSPASTVFFYWVGCDFSAARFRAGWPRRFFRTAVLPNLVSNWAVWIPPIFAIHALPTPLQIQLSGLVGSFWSLVLLALGRQVSRDAGDARRTSSCRS